MSAETIAVPRFGQPLEDELVWWVIGHPGQHYAIIRDDAPEASLGEVQLVDEQPSIYERPNAVASSPEEVEELLNQALTVARRRASRDISKRRLVVFIDDIDILGISPTVSALLTHLTREGRRGGVICVLASRMAAA